MDEKQPDEIKRPVSAPVSKIITQAADAIRAEGGVDWKCDSCKAAGVLPYGAHAILFRKGHQKVADKANTGENFEEGPPWLACGVLLPKCPNCSATANPNDN